MTVWNLGRRYIVATTGVWATCCAPVFSSQLSGPLESIRFTESPSGGIILAQVEEPALHQGNSNDHVGLRFTPIMDKILVAKPGAGMRISNAIWRQPAPGGGFRQVTTGSVAAVLVRLGRKVRLHFATVCRQGGRNIA